MRAHYKGRGLRRPRPSRLLSISILLVELSNAVCKSERVGVGCNLI